MPDDLYDSDARAWSLQQAELLRRHARGEPVTGVDWEHVVEEIDDVGLSQLNAVQSYLRLMMVHLRKLHAWPESPSANQRREEIAAFQTDAAQRFTPSMRQRIDLERACTARRSASLRRQLAIILRLSFGPTNALSLSTNS
ncbi:MAG: DUF29 domain-containing protein [Acetobacteraceae bacterium]|nr:DUF29 domain-containing protein [Acetobacteraceae bacterium]